MSIGQKLEKIATKEDLFPELSAEEKEANKTVAKIVTDADKIRAMADEELVKWAAHIKAWLDWLKQEVQDAAD